MIGLVVTRSPSRKLGEPLIDPITDPSAFALQPERAATPFGGAFAAGAVFLAGAGFFA